MIESLEVPISSFSGPTSLNGRRSFSFIVPKVATVQAVLHELNVRHESNRGQPSVGLSDDHWLISRASRERIWTKNLSYIKIDRDNKGDE
jgi:hypothetical protein